jgi:hypothetical protein
MIAVCLLTCGPARQVETHKTAASFARFNSGRDDLVLLHVDGGGAGREENLAIAKTYGLETIHAPVAREGQINSLRAFMADARVTASDLVLWLENDWESDAPIPPPAFFHGLEHVDQFRLFGARKMRGNGPRAPAGQHIIGTKTLIDWEESARDGWDIGVCHWGAGGTLVRPWVLRAGAAAAPRLKDIITTATHLVTMRPTENILWHIGAETTGGFFG